MGPTNKNYYILGVLAIAIVAVIVYLFNNPKEEPVAPVVSTTIITTQNANPDKTVATVFYTNKGFSPNTLEVSAGTKVTFINQSDKLMWVASSAHPTHQDLLGFDALRGVRAGSSYEYTFTKVGTWKYHDHLKPGTRGLITVK